MKGTATPGLSRRAFLAGASALGRATIAFAAAPTQITTMARFEKLMLDQDTGGAIRTAGRADIYFGVGEAADERAGAMRVAGQMYYLFLKE